LYHRQHAPSATDRDRYVNHSWINKDGVGGVCSTHGADTRGIKTLVCMFIWR
jgi:hypothetical protein